MNAKFFALIFLVSPISHANAKGELGEIFNALIEKSVKNSAGKSLVDTQSIEIALTKMADQLNKRLPMAVDKETRWDNILPGPGRRITYNYTFTLATIRDIDTKYFLETMQTQLKNGACSNPDMKIFFTNEVTVSYSYRAADGIFVGKIDITPKDCSIS